MLLYKLQMAIDKNKYICAIVYAFLHVFIHIFIFFNFYRGFLKGRRATTHFFRVAQIYHIWR